MAPRPHLPDIIAIRKVLDPEIQFYAIIGACISLVASNDHALFECYLAASGLPQGDAAKEFYRYAANFDRKRGLADTAIKGAVASRFALSKRWDELQLRAQQYLGPLGARNLLAHNPVLMELTFFIPDEKLTDGTSGEFRLDAEFSISQHPTLVSSGMRPGRTEAFEELASYALGLLGLCLSLRKFAIRLRAACGRSLPSDAPAFPSKARRNRTKNRSPP